MKYFGKLETAIKYIRVGEVFYAYLQAIAKAYPEFDGNPPPMTASKQEHIVSTLSPLFQFMKDRCLSKYTILKPNLPVQEFYTKYTEYCKGKGIKPLVIAVASRIISNKLEINSIRPY